MAAGLQAVQRALQLAEAERDSYRQDAQEASSRARAAEDASAKSSSLPRASASPSVITSAAPESSEGRDLRVYVTQLFRGIEAKYAADLEAGFGSAQLVDRLTANLRSAKEAWTQRLARSGLRGDTLFDDHLSGLLDAKTTTSFSRHLSIAVYAFESAATGARALQAQASC
jgi:hypothetical protein